MSHSERIQEAAKAVDEDCPLPWEVHGDSPEKPPMIWDAKGDAIVCQMPDGTPYFEAEVAALIVAAVNSISKHIPEQNERYWINRIYNAAVDIDLGNKESLDEIKSLCRRSLATPSEPLGVTKPLGVEPVPTISSNAGVPIRPREDCMSEDKKVFVDALMNPPEPNAALSKAAEAYKEGCISQHIPKSDTNMYVFGNKIEEIVTLVGLARDYISERKHPYVPAINYLNEAITILSDMKTTTFPVAPPTTPLISEPHSEAVKTAPNGPKRR